MSQISALVGGSQGLYAWLKQVTSANPQTQTSQVPGEDSGSSAADMLSSASGHGTTSGKAHGGHHHHHHNSTGLSSGLQTAVTNALQNTSGSTNPNTAIQNAIASFLANSAQTSQTGATSMTSAAATTGITATPTTAGTTNTGTTPTTTVAPDTQNSATQQFFQLLRAKGVTPEDFQQDVVAGFQQAQTQTGNSNLSQLFTNFPPGALVDEWG